MKTKEPNTIIPEAARNAPGKYAISPEGRWIVTANAIVAAIESGLRANAEALVRAANAAPDLAEALRAITRGLTNGQRERRETSHSIARDALKKAGLL